MSANGNPYDRPSDPAKRHSAALTDGADRAPARAMLKGTGFTDETKAEMKRILEEIRSGAFAEEWIAESRGGRKRFQQLRDEGKAHPVEQVGKELRSMMPWIAAGKQSVEEASGGALD